LPQPKLQFRSMPKLCAYCGKRPGTTRDHVVPRGVFDPNPEDSIIVRGCEPCNREKAKLDVYFRDNLVVDVLGHVTPTGSKIFHGPLARSVVRHQSELAKDFLSTYKLDSSPPIRELAGTAAVYQPKQEAINAELVFIVKGLSAVHHGAPVPSTYRFDFMIPPAFNRDAVAKEIRRLRADEIFNVGNGDFLAFNNPFVGDERSEVWHLAFYRVVLFSVAILSPTLHDEVEALT
jgi:hypothetical protein